MALPLPLNNPFSSSTLLTFNMQATRKPLPFYPHISLLFCCSWNYFVGAAATLSVALFEEARRTLLGKFMVGSPRQTPYRHSLLLKFLHTAFFTCRMMILFSLPIFWQFLICNKICIKNKTSAATLLYVFCLPFWAGQACCCCYFSSLVTLFGPRP